MLDMRWASGRSLVLGPVGKHSTIGAMIGAHMRSAGAAH